MLTLHILLSLLDVNECASNPCKNGGSCTDLVNDYNCSCTGLWEGKNCIELGEWIFCLYLVSALPIL